MHNNSASIRILVTCQRYELRVTCVDLAIEIREGAIGLGRRLNDAGRRLGPVDISPDISVQAGFPRFDMQKALEKHKLKIFLEGVHPPDVPNKSASRPPK